MTSVWVVIRSLRRTPGLTTTIVLTLALGIGLATAVFTFADALLVRPLPVRDEDRLVVLWGETPDGRFRNIPLAIDETRDFASRSSALEHVAFFAYYGAGAVPVRSGDRVSLAQRALVSGNFFDVLGARPALGRAIAPDDDLPGATPVAVLSHAGWQRHFAGDSAVVGRRIVVHETGVSHTIVGVMPQGLDYPRGTELWAPIIPSTTRPGSTSSSAEVDVLARLRPGAAPVDAQRELTELFQRDGARTLRRGARGVVHTLPNIVLGDTKRALTVAAAAAALLLLITCINVANLLLVRGVARMGDLAVRSALGATRRTIVAHLFAESAILATAGGVLGTLVAGVVVRGVVLVAPAGLPRLDEVRLDGAVLVAAVAITGASLVLFAVAPALLSSRVDLQSVLRATARQSGGSRRFRRVAEALVVGQVALALLVLSASALIARSFIELSRVKLALEPSSVLIATLAIDRTRFDTMPEQLALLGQLVSRLEATPRVRAVSPVVALPFSPVAWDTRPSAEGQTAEQAATNPMLNMEVVTPGYFRAMGMPILRGRGFEDGDRTGTLPVVLLSDGAARNYWPNEDPIGKRLKGFASSLTVVGIVPDARYRNLRDARPSIYFPLAQSTFPFAPTSLAIRTVGPPADLVPLVRRVVDETDPAVSISSAAPFETFLAREHAHPRLHALLLAVFAVAGVALAAIGLFGVVAAMVRQRARELGLRMALGATAGDVRRMVIGRGLALGGAGAAIGLAGALATNRLLGALLFQVSPSDGTTLGAVAGLLLAVAVLASAIPARASGRIDPAATLRTEG